MPVQTFHQPGVSSFKVGVSNGLFKIAAMDNGYGGHVGNFNNNKDQIIAMDVTGKVGIGTTQPDAKLTVKGKIHAEEVKVDLSVPGPDYVFEKTYDLKPLTEVELFIAINKHLPEIPSAKTMEKEGVNVGDMQMALLKKVEEITLYLIEIKKENLQLKNRLEELENKK
jgi:hypothetical protein